MESKNSIRHKQGQLSSLAYTTNRYTARTGRAFGTPTLDTLARGVAFGLLALAVTPFILTTPVHAADDNTVELTISSDADLKYKQSPSSPYLYEATTPVKIKAKPRGFNLTIHADSADLVNTKDNSRRIKGTIAFIDKESGREVLMGMNANSWGYRLEEGLDTGFMPNGFMHVPAGDEAPSVIIDTASEYDNAGCKGKKQCEVHMTFGAAILPNSLAAGKYSTTVTYTVTAKPAPKPVDWPQRTAKANPSETCQAGNTNSSCLVTLDHNMIPVKYTGSTTNAQWTSVADPEAVNSGWYDYANKQWANAVTVKKEALSKYRGFSKVVDQSDILGFWVYIPRYRYKVLRFSGSDPAVSAQNFTIEFENKHSTKATPTANGTWATHPAFTFGIKELNGIWFAKFETTWNGSQPTVLPNEAHMSGYYTASFTIGRMYSTAKTLGVADGNNVGGNTDYTAPLQNNHYLARFSSHMVNNNDWGAATYLSASKYGAGYNKVQINANGEGHTTYGKTYGVTGCGPRANGDVRSYGDNNSDWRTDYTSEASGALGTQTACYYADPQRAYNGYLGQLASTTNNVYGIYDMSGGGYEYVAAGYSDNLNNSNTVYFRYVAHPPYVNNYNFSNFNYCTYQTCGGQALHEVNDGNGTGTTNNWNGNYSYPVNASQNWPWFYRGGNYNDDLHAGIFASNSSDGYVYSYNDAFRVALAPLQD